MFSQPTEKCKRLQLIASTSYQLALFEKCLSGPVNSTSVFTTEELLIMYLAAANFLISSSGRMPASLYAPKVVACTGIPRASLIALLSRL